MEAVLTVDDRRRKLDAMIEELVEQGIPRAEATTHVRDTVVHEYDVILVPPPQRKSSRRHVARPR